jgi:hypothetical protein
LGGKEGGKYGDALLRTIKGKRYITATKFIVTIFEYSGVGERTMVNRFTGISEAAMRSKLHGWLLWAEFCKELKITPEHMRSVANPACVVSEFVNRMYEDDVSETKKREAMPAVYELFDVIRNDANLGNNTWLKGVLRSCTTAVKKQSKYRDIWDLGLLLDYLRELKPPEQAGWSDLMMRTAAIFMVFVPLRPAAMLRLDPRTVVKSKLGRSIEVTTCDKTDARRALTKVVIRPLEDIRLCPLKHFSLLVAGAKARGVTDNAVVH